MAADFVGVPAAKIEVRTTGSRGRRGRMEIQQDVFADNSNSQLELPHRGQLSPGRQGINAGKTQMTDGTDMLDTVVRSAI
jgi:hypothetical protein